MMTVPVYAIPKKTKRGKEIQPRKNEDKQEIPVEFQKLFDRAMGREDAERKK